MKRSEINRILRAAQEFFSAHRFVLPPFAHWSPDDWRAAGPACAGIVDAGLGWDLTDFGSGRFEETGLVLFTLRNGLPGDERPGAKPYCEKIMIAGDGQVTPMHFHRDKIEDIINRGGGRVAFELYHADAGDGLDRERPLEVQVDGVARTLEPGEELVLGPGESLTLEQRVYHTFRGVAPGGRILVGEVSTVNDDAADNVFLEELPRFPEITEDEEPRHPLVGDYDRYFFSGKDGDG